MCICDIWLGCRWFYSSRILSLILIWPYSCNVHEYFSVEWCISWSSVSLMTQKNVDLTGRHFTCPYYSTLVNFWLRLPTVTVRYWVHGAIYFCIGEYLVYYTILYERYGPRCSSLCLVVNAVLGIFSRWMWWILRFWFVLGHLQLS